MARGRFLSTSVAEDVALNSMSLEAHWLYLMTIPHLDRDGLIKADTYLLFGKVCPRRPEWIARIDDLVDEWAALGLVIIYNTREGRVAFFKGFTKNQQGMHYAREGASQLEPPPGYIRTSSGLAPTQDEYDDLCDSGTEVPTPDSLPTNSGHSPAEVKDQVQYKAAAEAAAAALAVSPPHSASEYVKAYQRIWGMMVASEYIGEQILEWETRVTYEGWCYALQECVDNRKHGQWSYLRPILQRLEREGYQSKEMKTQVLEFALEDMAT